MTGTCGPPRTPETIRDQRVARGQSPYPRLAIVTGSLDLDVGSTLFTEAPEPPYVFTTTDADAERVEALSGVADVHRVGSGRVDLTRMSPFDNSGDALTGGYIIGWLATCHQTGTWLPLW